MINIEHLEGFEWDKGNLEKNWIRHNVLNTEIEQVFFNQPLVLLEDEKHSSEREKRYNALGRSDNNRFLFVTFTIRNRLIRVISARDMSRKERKEYEEA